MAEYAPLGVHGSAAAAPPSDSLTIQLYVPIEPCLALASQPGAKIEQQTGCKLTVLEVVPEAVAVDRLVKVTGTLAGVNKAAELILDLTAPPLAALDPPASDGLPPAAPMCLLKLALTNAQVGGVIGKSGATIRQIREDSGAAIKVDAGRGTPDNPRLMSISGNRTAVVKAHLHTIFKLATLPEDGGGAACSTPPNSAPTHQFVKATAHLGSPQQQQQVRQQGWGGACGVPESPPPAYGFLAGHGCAPCGYSAVSGSWAPPQMTQATLPMGAGGIGSMGGLGNIGAMAQTLAMDTREQLVPAPLIGNLIGKGGSAIREIRQLSGANIKISQGIGGAPGAMAGAISHEQLVAEGLVGRLIGKGGGNIRQIRELTGTAIKISSECEPGTDERKIAVSGAPNQVQYALGLIQMELDKGV